MAANEEMPVKLPTLKDRESFDTLVKGRFFFAQSFEPYGGTKGLYDLGPPGCAMKANLLNWWRRMFIIEEGLMEVDTTCLTPEVVLQTSGHVARFQDHMVRDAVTLDCHRADHLLEERMDELMEADGCTAEENTKYKQVKAQADNMSLEELGKALKDFQVKAPLTGNDITEPFPFNLMFETSIGPQGNQVGYLRPETAQGIFMNFSRLLEQNNGRVPFGAACIGTAFRNEICPRAGLLRVREFTMAEIEYFVHPTIRDHPKFSTVTDYEINLLPRAQQLAGDHSYCTKTVGEAVAEGMIANQTLGYFIARCAIFLIHCGAKKEYLRFRQHLDNEMAHYAKDCWDGELLTSYGWIECVGNADRSCYDLTVHAKKTNTRQAFYQTYDPPRVVKAVKFHPNKGLIGRTLRRESSKFYAYMTDLSQEELLGLMSKWNEGQYTITNEATGDRWQLDEKMIKWTHSEETIHGEHLTPSVIEPSYGIGRILYALLEQSYYIREGDEQRHVVALSPAVAPVKCSVLPLMAKAEFAETVTNICKLLSKAGISNREDSSGATIGRRYARTDEIGIPFGITVDYATLGKDGAETADTVTLRERDSMLQVRVPIEELPNVILSVINGQQTWNHVTSQYPAQK